MYICGRALEGLAQLSLGISSERRMRALWSDRQNCSEPPRPCEKCNQKKNARSKITPSALKTAIFCFVVLQGQGVSEFGGPIFPSPAPPPTPL